MDRELLAAAQRGDEAAFVDLIPARSNRLFAIAQRILRDIDRAEDALQDALVIAWRDLRGLRDPDRFDAWLTKLLVRVCIAHASRERRRTANLRVLPVEGPAAPDELLTIADRDVLERGFQRLSPDQRAVLVLYHFLGYAPSEIAETLGIPMGTARSRLFHAHRAMRAALDRTAASRSKEVARHDGRTRPPAPPRCLVCRRTDGRRRSRDRRRRRPDRSAAAVARVAPPILEVPHHVQPSQARPGRCGAARGASDRHRVPVGRRFTLHDAEPDADPTPTPTATPAPTTPSASPSPIAVYPAWFTSDGDGAGILPAGTNTTRQFMPGTTFAVPVGWVNDGDDPAVYTLFPDSRLNQDEYARSKQTAQNMLVTDRIANNMFAICDAAGLFQGTTASEVVSGMVANKALSVTQPLEVTIGGLRGQQVDVRVSPKWKGTCALNPDEPPTTDYLDDRNRVIVLDKPVTGMIGISIGSARSSAFESFLAAATPIVESFQFDFGTGPTPRP